MSEPCCALWTPNYGCPHEICPGCYCGKGHEQNVCGQCHAYNVAEKFEPYLERYGSDNVRKEW